MAQNSYNDGGRAAGAGTLFGVPLADMGWFASLLMGLATGFAAFFLATFLAIISMLFWNAAGHHADYALTYRWVGLPVGVAVALGALGYLGVQWMRRIGRKG